VAKQQQSNLVANGKVVAAIIGSTFGAVEFTVPDNAGVYDNRSGRSTVAVTAKVPLAALALSVVAKVYADLGQDGLVTFRTSIPQPITLGESIRDEFKRHVKSELGKWSGFKRAATLAHGRLTAVKGANNPDAPLTFDPNAVTDESEAASEPQNSAAA
jgi:hypothetical protein